MCVEERMGRYYTGAQLQAMISWASEEVVQKAVEDADETVDCCDMDWEVTPDTPNLKRKRDEESTWIPRKKRRISTGISVDDDSFPSPALTLSSLFLSIIDSPATWSSFYYQPPKLGRTVRQSARLAALQ
jgi:hypothetical protein